MSHPEALTGCMLPTDDKGFHWGRFCSGSTDPCCLPTQLLQAASHLSSTLHPLTERGTWSSQVSVSRQASCGAVPSAQLSSTKSWQMCCLPVCRGCKAASNGCPSPQNKPGGVPCVPWHSWHISSALCCTGLKVGCPCKTQASNKYVTPGKWDREVGRSEGPLWHRDC